MKRGILAGAGGWGAWWCEKFLPPNIKDGTVKIVAAVDNNQISLQTAKRFLHLSDAQCFSDAETAFASVPADFCIIVVPPAFHESIVDAAIRHNLHILSEKPIADTLEASICIAEKVKKAGLHMGITMSHRFDQDKTNLRELLQSKQYGELDYLSCRYTCDLRLYGSWGEFRHEIPNSILIEGSVHHLDMLADMAGSKCKTLYAQTWRPPWAQYKGYCQALITMEFENGKHALYEAANANAVSLNPWGNEYIRAECEKGTLVMDRREIMVYPYQEGASWTDAASVTPLRPPLRTQKKWANTWLVEKFVNWIEGGDAMETEVQANLQSIAMVSAAIKSADTGKPVMVQDLLCSDGNL